MWIEIIPRRSDFCGRPPCGLCYRWADDGKTTDAVDKMLSDMLPGIEPTNAQRATVLEAIERMHYDNVARNARPEEPPSLDAGAAAYTEAQQKRMLEMQINAAAEARRKAAAIKPIVRETTIDQMSDEARAKFDANATLSQVIRQAKERMSAAAEARREAAAREVDPRSSWTSSYLDATKPYDEQMNALRPNSVVQAQLPVCRPTTLAWSFTLPDDSVLLAYTDDTLRLRTKSGASIQFTGPLDALEWIIKHIPMTNDERFNKMRVTLETMKDMAKAKEESQWIKLS